LIDHERTSTDATERDAEAGGRIWKEAGDRSIATGHDDALTTAGWDVSERAHYG
jgi:hypothetical protein